MSVELFQKALPSEQFHVLVHTYGDFIPNVFPGGTTVTDELALSFFMQVQDVP